MAKAHKKSPARLASNRKALRDYSVIERLEAGIELRGTEVKSLRGSNVSLSGSFAKIEDRQAFIYNLTILPYEFGNRFNHPPTRPRRLLLHRKEIDRLQIATEQKGHALIPLSLYMKHGIVKLELGLCKGKTGADKRETLKRKTAAREADRAIAQHQHR